MTRMKHTRWSRLIRKERDPHGWWACLCNGIPIRFAAEREPLVRYASDPDYRASLITKKA